MKNLKSFLDLIYKNLILQEMETESAADVLQTLSLEPSAETSQKPSGGAASKFKKKDKKKKKKNF